MKLTKPLMSLLCLLTLSCTSSLPPEYGLVDWYFSNGTGTKMTLVVYDKICKRTFYRVRIAMRGPTEITTCSDSNGSADIRYKRAGGSNSSAYPWVDRRMKQNQSLYIR